MKSCKAHSDLAPSPGRLAPASILTTKLNCLSVTKSVIFSVKSTVRRSFQMQGSEASSNPNKFFKQGLKHLKKKTKQNKTNKQTRSSTETLGAMSLITWFGKESVENMTTCGEYIEMLTPHPQNHPIYAGQPCVSNQ